MAEVVELEVGRFALRTFHVHSGGLHSIIARGSGKHWDKGVCRARCVLFDDAAFLHTVARVMMKAAGMSKHKAPDKDCWCGVYGSLDLANLHKQYTQSLMFVAVIAAEGKTIIGSRGLRTEYARIVAYWTPWYQFYNRRVARRECPEAQSYKDLNKMLKDYGIPRKADSDTPPSLFSWWT